MAKKISQITPQMKALEKQIEREFDMLLLDYAARAKADQKAAWESQFRQLAKVHRAEEKERRKAFLEAGGKYPAKIVYTRPPSDDVKKVDSKSLSGKKTSPSTSGRQQSAS